MYLRTMKSKEEFLDAMTMVEEEAEKQMREADEKEKEHSQAMFG